MYGLIGKMLAVPGKREGLLAILTAQAEPMPGCLSYVVARVWITEVWDNQQRHQASLQLPAVQAMIAIARPMIAGFGERFETEPLSGAWLA